ncbi:MAG: ABC transporter permease [Oscillospiraceae bacterium]|nr:ABC transporter permease [Oscillospiraceae bacterium]
MTTILRREIKAYFSSPIGYILLAAFWALSGWYFYASVLLTATAELRSVYSAMGTISMFLIPMMTMRLFSEDKRLRTEQALLTAPISIWELVLGKFLSAVCIYAVNVGIALVFGITVTVFAPVEWLVVIGLFVGMMMFGSAMISIGMFISALTENQIVAAIGTFAALLFLGILDTVAELVNVGFVKDVLYAISFNDRFNGFTLGMLQLRDVVFFLSVMLLFCYFTTRVFERRRYN